MPKPVFTLSPDGYFQHRGQRVVPVGVNYWPSSCGVEMWQAWPVAEILRDLDTMQALGFNCVRFFLRWEDFEPTPGRYRAEAFARLAEFLGWCRKRSLFAHPSLFVGWMSGGVFWPEWKQERNLFSDALMRRRSFAFAARAARVCMPYRDIMLAIDQGNEICCVADAPAAPPADVASWCAGVNAAVRRVFPDALLISGNEQSQITADNGWRFGSQPGCDLYSMHTYPNSGWHSLRFDGMGDPLAQSLFPLYVKCARIFGPVMMQEFGTIFTVGDCCDTYVRAVLTSAWEAGANGFLWWSLRDFTASGHPYDKNAFEGPLGLLGANDRIKPSLKFFGEFAASLPDRPSVVPDTGDVALYWPKHYYHRDDPLNPGNEPRLLSRRLVIAHFTLTTLGYRVGIARGDRPLGDGKARVLCITGASLTAEEIVHLTEWVRSGGTLIWQGVDVATYGSAANTLIGAEAIDLRAPRSEGIKAFGAAWEFREFARDILVEVKPSTADIAATDNQGRAILLVNRLGQGRVVTCLAQPDDQFAARSDDLDDRARWCTWYRGLLDLAEIAGATSGVLPTSGRSLRAVAGR